MRKSGERNFWMEIGAAWPHGDGDGFNLKLEFMPISSNAEIVIRKPKAGDTRLDHPAG